MASKKWIHIFSTLVDLGPLYIASSKSLLSVLCLVAITLYVVAQILLFPEISLTFLFLKTGGWLMKLHPTFHNVLHKALAVLFFDSFIYPMKIKEQKGNITVNKWK